MMPDLSFWWAIAVGAAAVIAIIVRTLLALFVDWRPRVTSEQCTLPADDVDYIVVGGGSAGAVLAARLIEGSETASVLVLEAGPEDVGPVGSAFFKVPMAALGFQPTSCAQP